MSRLYLPILLDGWCANVCFAVPLNEVPYVDRPNIELAEGESVEMPFKYVKGKDGKAIMPEVTNPCAHVVE